MPISNLGANPSLKQLVYQELKANIINGEYKPSTKLTEEALSSQMNISRAPIREALNMLERDGFVKIESRRGAFVTEVNKEDIKNIWELRILLEPFAAQQSVGLPSTKQLNDVKKKLEGVEKNPYSMELYVESDLLVHELCIEHLSNKILKDIILNLREHSLRLRWATEYENPEKQKAIILESTEEHLKIVNAFIKSDKDSIYESVKTHIENAEDRLMYGEIYGCR